MKTICTNCQTPLEWDPAMYSEQIDCPVCSKPMRLYLDSQAAPPTVLEERRKVLAEIQGEAPPMNPAHKLICVGMVVGGLIGVWCGSSHPAMNLPQWAWIVAGAITGMIYVFPGVLAIQRKHSQLEALLALNIFGGLIYIGWVAALVWALIKPEAIKRSENS